MSRLDRARILLRRPGAWIDTVGDAYGVRLAADRRARPHMKLDEDDFRALIADPGVKVRPRGGWVARAATVSGDIPVPPGRPGWIEGQRPVIGADGDVVLRRANLGESAVAWLARRKDAEGRPLLTPAEAAAGERLRQEAEIALSGPSLTLRWDALPRGGRGSGVRAEPGIRALSAERRVEAALRACGPARSIVEAVCVRGSSLQMAESELGLRRRTGKAGLKLGLRALAAHYRIG